MITSKKASLSLRLSVVLIVISCLAAISKADAQIQFGVKGGLNITELLSTSYLNVNVNGIGETVRDFPRADFNAGVMVSIPIRKRWSFQPELVFSGQGASGKTSGNLFSANIGYNFNYINLPLLIKYNAPVGFFLETGPQLGLLVSAKAKEDFVGSTGDNDYNIKSSLKSTDIAWVLGAGYLSPIDLGFDLRYNYGLTNISNVAAGAATTAPFQTGTLKNSVVQLTVFYLFGKGKFAPVYNKEVL